jgi:hypothetical protein
MNLEALSNCYFELLSSVEMIQRRISDLETKSNEKNNENKQQIKLNEYNQGNLIC